MNQYNNLVKVIKEKGAAYLILIDPDKLHIDKLEEFIPLCERSDVDGFLIGGSLTFNVDINSYIKKLKSLTNLPKIIFPGSESQLSREADAVLFLSVISGRNPEHLIGKHILAAPIVKAMGIEPISTGYMLVDSGRMTTAHYISNSFPIPNDKPEIASATALAGEYLGMKLIYLEAGSGAQNTVSDEIISAVKKTCSVPIIVGGGIKTPELAYQKVKAGADIIVTGNFFEDKSKWPLIKEFAKKIHSKLPIEI